MKQPVNTITHCCRAVTAVATAAALLSGCAWLGSGSDEEQIVYVTVTSSGINSPSAGNKTAAPEEPSTVVVTVTEEEQPPQQVPGGDPDGIPPYPGAGGPLPPRAVEATNIIPQLNNPSLTLAAVQNPGGTVLCGIYPDGPGASGRLFECQIPSLKQTMKYGRNDMGPTLRPPRWFVRAAEDGTTDVGSVTDVSDGLAADPENSQIIGEGEVVAFGKVACAGNNGGLTCWVIGSGHGADMADNYFRSF